MVTAAAILLQGARAEQVGEEEVVAADEAIAATN